MKINKKEKVIEENTLYSGFGICSWGEYKGQKCDCASCRLEDGYCVCSESGGGCGVCDGPVQGCELVISDKLCDS